MSDLSLPPVKRRWVTTVFFFLSGIITATWASRIPDVQKELALNDAQWGFVLFALPAGLTAGLPLSSWLVAKFSARRIIIITMISFAITLVCLSLSSTIWQLVVSLFFFGLSRNATNISLNTHAIEVQHFFTKPIVSTFHGIWSVACFIAAGIGTLMIAYGVDTLLHFLFISVGCVVAAVLCRSVSMDKPEHVKEKKPLLVMPDRYLVVLGLICFCSMMIEGTMFDWSVNYFEKVVAVKRGFTTVGYSSFIVTMAIGRLLGDKLLALFGPVVLLMANGVLMAAGLLIAIIFPFLIMASVGFLLVGLGTSSIVPMIYTLASRTSKMETGYAIVSVTMIGYVGFLFGPLIIGIISEHAGMQSAFGLLAILSLLIVGLTGLLGSIIKKAMQV